MYIICMGTVYRTLNLMFMIHTRDHGFPHVTVYRGNPESFEAMAKIKLADASVIESEGFSQKALNKIIGVVLDHKDEWLEEWNDYHK